MRISRVLAVSGVLLASLAGLAQAQDVVVYPAKGQTAEQTEQDKFQCYTWAKGETGFDPMERPTASSAPPPEGSESGGVVKGAAVGALGGLAVGAIAGDAGKGAAIGAVGGGLFGGVRQRNRNSDREAESKQWEQQQVAQYEQARGGYTRAYAACLEGRGYSVK